MTAAKPTADDLMAMLLAPDLCTLTVGEAWQLAEAAAGLRAEDASPRELGLECGGEGDES